MKKRILLLIIICFYFSNAFTQKNEENTKGTIPKTFFETNSLYLSSKVSLGNFSGFSSNLNYVWKNSYSLSLGFSSSSSEDHSAPDDYTGDFSLFGGNSHPKNVLNNYTLMFGKIVNFKTNKIRLNLAIGAGYGKYTENHNWQKKKSSSWGSILSANNYTWDKRKTSIYSLIINPEVEFIFTKYFGLSFSPIVQISDKKTFYGAGIGILLGKIR